MVTGLRAHAAAANRALSLCLGGVVLVAAAAAAASLGEPRAVLAWGWEVLGPVFLAGYLGLVWLAVFAWARLAEAAGETARFWRGLGLHAGNGVATLALTFTLYGIAAGVASLADHDLNPVTINAVIRDLTRHFSLAFMTTVVGLPTAALLRALLQLSWRGREGQPPCGS